MTPEEKAEFERNRKKYGWDDPNVESPAAFCNLCDKALYASKDIILSYHVVGPICGATRGNLKACTECYEKRKDDPNLAFKYMNMEI